MSITIDSTIDAAGRVIVPKAMRDALHLSAGVAVRLTLDGNRIEIERQPIEAHVDMADGFPVIVCDGEMPYAATDLEAARKAVREDRQPPGRRTR